MIAVIHPLFILHKIIILRANAREAQYNHFINATGGLA